MGGCQSKSNKGCKCMEDALKDQEKKQNCQSSQPKKQCCFLCTQKQHCACCWTLSSDNLRKGSLSEDSFSFADNCLCRRKCDCICCQSFHDELHKEFCKLPKDSKSANAQKSPLQNLKSKICNKLLKNECECCTKDQLQLQQQQQANNGKNKICNSITSLCYKECNHNCQICQPFESNVNQSETSVRTNSQLNQYMHLQYNDLRSCHREFLCEMCQFVHDQYWQERRLNCKQSCTLQIKEKCKLKGCQYSKLDKSDPDYHRHYCCQISTCQKMCVKGYHDCQYSQEINPVTFEKESLNQRMDYIYSVLRNENSQKKPSDSTASIQDSKIPYQSQIVQSPSDLEKDNPQDVKIEVKEQQQDKPIIQEIPEQIQIPQTQVIQEQPKPEVVIKIENKIPNPQIINPINNTFTGIFDNAIASKNNNIDIINQLDLKMPVIPQLPKQIPDQVFENLKNCPEDTENIQPSQPLQVKNIEKFPFVQQTMLSEEVFKQQVCPPFKELPQAIPDSVVTKQQEKIEEQQNQEEEEIIVNTGFDDISNVNIGNEQDQLQEQPQQVQHGYSEELEKQPSNDQIQNNNNNNENVPKQEVNEEEEVVLDQNDNTMNFNIGNTQEEIQKKLSQVHQGNDDELQKQPSISDKQQDNGGKNVEEAKEENDEVGELEGENKESEEVGDQSLTKGKKKKKKKKRKVKTVIVAI